MNWNAKSNCKVFFLALKEGASQQGYTARWRWQGGCICGHPSIWAGAGWSKDKEHEKNKMRPTDKQTEQGVVS